MVEQSAHDFAAEMYRDQIAKIQRSWNRWLNELDSFDQSQLSEPNKIGSWSVRDVLSHITEWDKIAIETVVGIATGEHRDTMESIQEINDRSILEAEGRTISEVIDRMKVSHDQLIANLHDLMMEPIDVLERIESAIAEPTWRHYDHHSRDLRELKDHFR